MHDHESTIPSYSMFYAFFFGSNYLMDFDELSKISKNHELILLRSLRGEKLDNSLTNNIETVDECPTIS